MTIDWLHVLLNDVEWLVDWITDLFCFLFHFYFYVEGINELIFVLDALLNFSTVHFRIRDEVLSEVLLLIFLKAWLLDIIVEVLLDGSFVRIFGFRFGVVSLMRGVGLLGERIIRCLSPHGQFFIGVAFRF